MLCQCKCHDPNCLKTPGCTSVFCKCGDFSPRKMPTNIYKSGDNKPFGTINENTSFKPISENSSSKDPSKNFDILKLNGTRYNNIDGHLKKKSPSPNQCNSSGLKKDKVLLTPEDFFNSIQVDSRSENFNNDRVIAENRESFVSNNLNNKSKNSKPISRGGNESEYYETSSPQNFFKNEQFTEKKLSEKETSGFTNVPQNQVPNNSSSQNSYSSKTPNGAAEVSPVTADSLSSFFNKIGFQEKHNTLLPSIPGGEAIVRRLENPEFDMVANLMQSRDKDKARNEDIIVRYDQLPNHCTDGSRPYIGIFWDIENCQVNFSVGL